MIKRKAQAPAKIVLIHGYNEALLRQGIRLLSKAMDEILTKGVTNVNVPASASYPQF